MTDLAELYDRLSDEACRAGFPSTAAIYSGMGLFYDGYDCPTTKQIIRIFPAANFNPSRVIAGWERASRITYGK